MDFHWRQGAKFASQFFGLQSERLLWRLAANQLRGQACDGDGGFTTERLKCRLVNNLSAIVLLEFDPQAQHFATVGVANRSNRIGVGQLPQILWVAQSLSDSFL